MTRFGENPRAFFEGVYRGEAPWDIGAAQPAMVQLFADHPPLGPVLDLGCGSGDLAIHLAGEGVEVLGVDFSEGAISQALDRAAVLPPEQGSRVTFRVADALHPSALGGSFGAVTDCGFLHLFDDDACARLAAEVGAAVRPGGRYYLLAFAVEFDIPHAPRAITAEDLRPWFSAGWRTLEIRPAEFLSRIAPVPAIAACLERA